jgi:hypothetical protein
MVPDKKHLVCEVLTSERDGSIDKKVDRMF